MFKKLGVKGDEVFGMDGGLEDAYYEDGGEVGEEEVVWSEGEKTVLFFNSSFSSFYFIF